MKSEKEKMLEGELYDPLDPQLVAERKRARLLFKALNDTSDDQQDERARLIRELIPASQPDLWIEPPFFCDYGANITIGSRVFMNYNCVILDVAAVRIGSGVLFGPSVHVYAATHPLSSAARRTGLESGRPINIGDDVWVGGGAVICPGVSIGAGTVIGAGSVDRGREARLDSGPPPSEPYVRISRIRLSGWWFYPLRDWIVSARACSREYIPVL